MWNDDISTTFKYLNLFQSSRDCFLTTSAPSSCFFLFGNVFNISGDMICSSFLRLLWLHFHENQAIFGKKTNIEPIGSIGSMVCLPTNWLSTINQMYQNMPCILGLPYFGGWIFVFFFRWDKILAYNKYILSFHGPPNTPNDDRGAAH